MVILVVLVPMGDKSREREKLNLEFRHKEPAFFGNPSGIKILNWRRERERLPREFRIYGPDTRLDTPQGP
jgi:hypothetical protein